MTKKLFCGGLPWEARDEDLSQAMSEFGPVTDAKVIMDRETGKSKGFGFVTFASEEGAQAALAAGSISMMGRTVRLDEATEKPGRGRPPGGQRDGGFRDGGGNRDDRGRGRGRGRREKRHKERGGSKKDRW